MTRAIDCLVNVDLGDAKQPEWMVRVKEDYFKGGDSFFKSPELPELLDDMDANGVARAILLTKLGKSGDRAQRYAAARPDRFSLGVGGLDLLRPMPTLRSLESFVRDHPVSYAVVGPSFWGDGMYPPSDAVYYPLYTKCCELDLPLCMNTGIPGPPIPGEAQNPIHLDRVCVRFPELRLCMIHGADPWWDVAIRLMLKYRNLRLMTSAWSPKRLPQSLLHYMSTRGKDRILFASDYPVLSIQRCLDEARKLDLAPEVLDALAPRQRRGVLLHDGGTPHDDPRPIDADNHYYESLDAFTRHLPKEFKQRGVRPVQAGKRVELLIGERVNRFVPNPTFDPDHRRGLPRPVLPRADSRAASTASKLMKVEPLRIEYRDRDARVGDRRGAGSRRGAAVPDARLRRRGGAAARHPRHDGEPLRLQPLARGRLGLLYEGRLIGVPMLSLADPDAALAEVDSLLERGARIVHVRPAPVPTASGGGRSLGDPLHDPVWARLAEAGVPVAFHLGDSGYNAFAGAWGAAATFEGFGAVDVLEPPRRLGPRRSTTPSAAWSSTACSTGTRSCASPASRTAPTGCTCS